MNEVSSILKKRKPNGYFSFTDKESGKTQDYYSAQCKHCGIHWQIVPGSGIQRGWCFNCHGVLCGQELCINECVPFEYQMQIQEGNKKAIEKYKNTETCKILRMSQEEAKKWKEKQEKKATDINDLIAIVTI